MKLMVEDLFLIWVYTNENVSNKLISSWEIKLKMKPIKRIVKSQHDYQTWGDGYFAIFLINLIYFENFYVMNRKNVIVSKYWSIFFLKK